MNQKLLTAICLAGALAAATYVYAQNQTKPAPADPRLDKLIEQNEQILKNQQEIINQLKDLKEGVTQLRRRSS